MKSKEIEESNFDLEFGFWLLSTFKTMIVMIAWSSMRMCNEKQAKLSTTLHVIKTANNTVFKSLSIYNDFRMPYEMKRCSLLRGPKGQTISKANYGHQFSQKTNVGMILYILKIFPTFIFWENWGHYELLSRFTDLFKVQC